MHLATALVCTLKNAYIRTQYTQNIQIHTHTDAQTHAHTPSSPTSCLDPAHLCLQHGARFFELAAQALFNGQLGHEAERG